MRIDRLNYINQLHRSDYMINDNVLNDLSGLVSSFLMISRLRIVFFFNLNNAHILKFNKKHNLVDNLVE